MVTNRRRVSVAPDSLRIFVNDTAVVSVASRGLPLEGQFGFQIGASLNPHVTTLDYTSTWLPTASAE